MAFQPLDPRQDIQRYQNHLPHWKQQGVTTFVTFRLGDSIPQEKLRAWEAQRQQWLRAHRLTLGTSPGSALEEMSDALRHEYHKRFTATFHDWLDAGYGECSLRWQSCSALVANSLRHFHGEGYALEAFVVMPNHVHSLVTPHSNQDMSAILHSWKSYTSNQLNALLERRGSIWQAESYDHLVRNAEQFAHYRRYIFTNPIKAKLRAGEFLWWDALGEPDPK